MDELDVQVRGACRLIRQGAVLPAYAQLRTVATRARGFPIADTTSLGHRLYAWLTWIGEAAEAAAIAGAPLGANAAAQFSGELSKATLVDQFETAVEALLDGARTPQLPAELTVARSKCYMEDNFHRGIRVEDVARAMGCTPRHLRYVWRQQKDASDIKPAECLRKYRVDAGRHLLEHTSKSIDQIADEVGYVSVSGFVRAFETLQRRTPSEYRRCKRPTTAGQIGRHETWPNRR